ncbi:MAG: prepilin-type N-terminal cleavage/methylation domain-containing protein [Ruminococcus sp.]|nr:prepilin-type N-terminal cleavage/methylation domain-containing protein [Ruminococcus sp.]
MNRRKKLRGFTLIELIIVMAIFGIIMLGVMKIADPLAKVMNKSSTKEKSAAYVDNISDYLDKSMRYAKYMQIYEGEFSDYALSEKEAVEEFVNDYYDGCIDSNNDLMKGQLHIMKVINQGSYGGGVSPTQITVRDGAGNIYDANDGEIWETIWEFTCGDSYIDDGGIKQWNESPDVKITDSKMVINREHLRDYGYYYRYGYSTFEAVDHAGTDAFFALDPSDVTVGSNRFAMSIVAYPTDNKEIQDDGSIWFKSPCYMNTMSMYLINSEKLVGSGATDIREAQNDHGIATPVDGEVPVEKLTINNTPFVKYPLTPSVGLSTDNLYFIYVLPSELYID